MENMGLAKQMKLQRYYALNNTAYEHIQKNGKSIDAMTSELEEMRNNIKELYIPIDPIIYKIKINVNYKIINVNEIIYEINVAIRDHKDAYQCFTRHFIREDGKVLASVYEDLMDIDKVKLLSYDMTFNSELIKNLVAVASCIRMGVTIDYEDLITYGSDWRFCNDEGEKNDGNE